MATEKISTIPGAGEAELYNWFCRQSGTKALNNERFEPFPDYELHPVTWVQMVNHELREAVNTQDEWRLFRVLRELVHEMFGDIRSADLREYYHFVLNHEYATPTDIAELAEYKRTRVLPPDG